MEERDRKTLLKVGAGFCYLGGGIKLQKGKEERMRKEVDDIV